MSCDPLFPFIDIVSVTNFYSKNNNTDPKDSSLVRSTKQYCEALSRLHTILSPLSTGIPERSNFFNNSDNSGACKLKESFCRATSS